MNKEQQIEEMAKIMCGNDCEECAKESAEFYNQTLEEARNNKCLLKNCAKTLYEQGYRKLPDGATVLLVGKYNQPLDGKTIEYFVKHNEQIRKEAVKEFAEKLRKKVISLNVWEFGEIDIIDVDDIDELLKEYEE